MNRIGRKRKSRLSVVLGAAAIVVLAVVGSATRPPDSDAAGNEAKISSGVIDATENGNETSFVVYMDAQADLSAAPSIKDEDARGWYVYRTLKQAAATSQAPLRQELDAAGVPYTSYWAVNMIVAEGDRELVEDIAERADVEMIEPNSVVDGLDGDEETETTDEGNEVAATEIGVTNTQSPGLWALGYTGQGIVVADQDTGMRWTHASLRTHYRGWGGSVAASDHNYNWHDSIHARITNADGGTASPATNSCGYNTVAPCDDQGHGTHTIGTSVGDDAGAGVGTGTNQIGVAPGAKWIGCRNMDAGNGRAATYTECFQFFLAPTNLQNQSADPTRRPHVMNNSWGCPQIGELCAPNVMKTIVENSEAAGIFVEASAGNNGSACNTVNDPPAIYASTFSTGAISGTTNALQGFSSRGSVSVDGSFRMKPDLSAPGASVRSSLRTSDTNYGTMSGTSMASPHVVGVVALLWSAKPKLLRDMPRTKWLLTRSANQNVTVASNPNGCGGIASRPNNHFGWGRVDALAAYNLEPSLNQSITFAPPAQKTLGDADFALGATASSGLDVSYAASGSCTVAGATVHITGVGPCTITASQVGIDVYGIEATAPKPWYPADDVSRTFTVVYPYAGFFAPVNNDKLNTAQAGSAIPVKFSLGVDQGLAILAAGSPTSISMSCLTSQTTDPIEATATAGQSSLQYDPITAEYIYVWKTDKSWAGTCRRLDVTLADGTVHSATFQFRK
jgi:serine protease AprX